MLEKTLGPRLLLQILKDTELDRSDLVVRCTIPQFGNLFDLNYMIETKVTYTLEHDGHFYLVENVPARIFPETGEQFFSPETVQRLQSFIFQKKEPKKLVQTPVFEFTT